ncbi:MAG: hypothetical protein N2109_09465 [Fimbriimonadales bacterium]|nr:hypothetical protein [Fimbriimonadales bacterium]
MRRLGLALLVVCALCRAQSPQVSAQLDAALTYRSASGGGTTLRTYDALSRPSTVRLAAALETGWILVVRERFEKLPRDPDTEAMQEYYLEDPGLWRLGKQHLPFAGGFLCPMYAKAATGYFPLPVVGIPVQAALVDDGGGRPQGVVARIGRALGLSGSVGRHLAVGSQTLAIFRTPEDPLPRGRGYKAGLALDATRKSGLWRVGIEHVRLWNGETPKDRTVDATDVWARLEPSRYRSLLIGYSRDWNSGTEVLRLAGSFWVVRNVWFEPLVRYRDGRFQDLGLTLRVRL